MKRVLIPVLFLFLTTAATAHGFGQRIDLPIPLSFYLIGGGTTVIVSFIMIALKGNRFFPKTYPSFNLSKLRTIRILTTAPATLAIKSSFVLFLLMIVAAGAYGNDVPIFNIAPAAVWIYFSIALVFFVAFIGNIWELVNPIKTLHEWFDSAYKLTFGKKLKPALPYPEKLSLWPAVSFYFAYRWIENNFERSSEPAAISIMITAYAIFTFLAMTVFGRSTWLRNGDPFSVLFRILSNFSITERKKTGTLLLRLPAIGILTKNVRTNFSMTVLIMLMMASLTWDGIKETRFWQNNFAIFSQDYGVNVFGIAFMLVSFLTVYVPFAYFMKKTARSKLSTTQIGNHFVLTLLPIAIAYEMTHFMVFLLTEGQRIIYLISDPFGIGWNVFGTASYAVNFGIANFKIIWPLQVGIIVIAHVASVYLAHATATKLFFEEKTAIRSQYPLIILMVLYTMFSLWILSQPLVAV